MMTESATTRLTLGLLTAVMLLMSPVAQAGGICLLVKTPMPDEIINGLQSGLATYFEQDVSLTRADSESGDATPAATVILAANGGQSGDPLTVDGDTVVVDVDAVSAATVNGQSAKDYLLPLLEQQCRRAIALNVGLPACTFVHCCLRAPGSDDALQAESLGLCPPCQTKTIAALADEGQ